MQEQTIACPICRKASPEFEELNRQINQAKTGTDKGSFARQLINKVEAVMREHGPEDGMETKACRSILALRKRTAEFVLSAQKLAD